MVAKLVSFNFKVQRKMIIGWSAVMLFFIGVTPLSMKDIITEPNGWPTFIEACRMPVGMIFCGPGYGFSSTTPNLGSATVAKTLLANLIMMAIFISFLVANLTRGYEEKSLTELLRGNGLLSKSSIPLAAGILAALSSLVICAGSFGLILATVDLAVADVAVMVLSIFLFCLFVIALTLLASSICNSARQTKTLVMGLIIGTMMIQAIAEIAATDEGYGAAKWYAWASPSFWPFATRVFDQQGINYFPLLLTLIVSLIILGIYCGHEHERDYGSSLIQLKEGRTAASKYLTGWTALKFKLARTRFLSQLVAFAFFGAIYGSLANVAVTILQKTPAFTEMIKQTGGSVQGTVFEEIFNALTVMILLMILLVIAGLSISMVNQVFANDEKSLRTEIFYATPVSRNKVLSSSLIVPLTYSLTILLAAVFAYGTVVKLTLKEFSLSFTDLSGFFLTRASVIIFFVALTVFWTAINASLSSLSFVYFGVTIFLSFFYELFHLPKWVTNEPPFMNLNNYPIHNSDVKAAIFNICIAIILVVAAKFIYQKRDIK